MTIQDLKDNRDLIIEKAKTTFGESELKDFMLACKEEVENNWTSEKIDDFLESMVDIFRDMQFEKAKPKKTSKLSESHCNNHIDEKYNLVTKQFNKI